MYALPQARRALAAVDLRQGLALAEVHNHLQQGLRLQDTGQRILAFYLTEMADRRLHQASGHSSTAGFAEDRLGLDRRRTGELIAVGRKLLTLPTIDRTFCEHGIGWAKILNLVKVATPEHEEAWLERALALTCRELALEVKLAKAGGPPRPPGDRKGLPEVRFNVGASVSVLTYQKLDLAKQKLSAERGHPVGDAECFDVLAELFLNSEEDGTLPGRTRVDASLYRVVLHQEGDDERLVADTDLGSIPIDGSESDDLRARVRSACIRCDGEPVDPEGRDNQEVRDGDIDPRTPPALRRRVLARDGARCRCCGSRKQLMVHHIRYRSKGGRTREWNLISLCVSCHSLVHAGLVRLEGKREKRIRFLDAQGQALHELGERVAPTALQPLCVPGCNEDAGAPAEPSPPPATFDTLPDVIDRAWWKRHAPLLRFRGEKGIEYREGRPLPEPPPSPAPTPKPFAEAFGRIVGQDALLQRLEMTATGSRARQRSFPHTLFAGPAGTGKTTLARGLARRFGARLLDTSGPLLQDAHSLVRLLAELCEGDMLFIDEVHAVPRAVLETLYQGLTEKRVTLTLHAGARTRAVRLELPAFTLLAATTEDGDLPDALLTRFGLRESLGYYASEDLTALVTQTARSQRFVLAADAATRLAEHARGTPREALRLLDRVLDSGACNGRSVLDRASVEAALEHLGYDHDGLGPAEQRYLALLRRSPAPISLERLSRALGSSARNLLRNVEPFLFLRGLVRMTPRGRTAAHKSAERSAFVTSDPQHLRPRLVQA